MKAPKFLRSTTHTGWEQLLLSILGITISIALTFGINALVNRSSRKADRKLAVVRVMANIESSARDLDQVHASTALADSTANYILDHLAELEQLPEETLRELMLNSAPYALVTYDKSVEQIFTSTFDVWRNVDNAKFIDMVGQAFHMMDIFSEEHNAWVQGILDYSDNFYYDHRDLEGKAFYLAYLKEPRTLRYLQEIHLRQDRLRYVSAMMRWCNRQNMYLMNVSEEEILNDVSDSQSIPTGEPYPDQNDFITPAPRLGE